MLCATVLRFIYIDVHVYTWIITDSFMCTIVNRVFGGVGIGGLRATGYLRGMVGLWLGGRLRLGLRVG